MLHNSNTQLIKDTPEEFEAIQWWNPFSPAEKLELRDKYARGVAIIDMSKKVIVNIWKQANQYDAEQI